MIKKKTYFAYMLIKYFALKIQFGFTTCGKFGDFGSM